MLRLDRQKTGWRFYRWLSMSIGCQTLMSETLKSPGRIAVLGVFVADAVYRAERIPKIGETLLGNSFALGPGGKGSNQSVAAARAGADVTFISRLGKDPFAQMALTLYQDTGVKTHIEQLDESYTGSAFIFVDDNSGDNAIIIAPGAASTITPEFVDSAKTTIISSDVFITQLEQPIAAATHALSVARNAGVTTVLNTAPAESIADAVFELCDYVTPNEIEAETYTGVAVKSVDDARHAADALLQKGVGTAIILIHNAQMSEHVPAFQVGKVVDTTGAGDAFNAGFATALSSGAPPLEAARFGCALAGLSVTRHGTSDSMPMREEILKVLNEG